MMLQGLRDGPVHEWDMVTYSVRTSSPTGVMLTVTGHTNQICTEVFRMHARIHSYHKRLPVSFQMRTITSILLCTTAGGSGSFRNLLTIIAM